MATTKEQGGDTSTSSRSSSTMSNNQETTEGGTTKSPMKRMTSSRWNKKVKAKKDHVVVGSTSSKREKTKFKENYFKRTVVLRIAAVTSLVVAAVICASVSYKLIYNLEVQVGHQTYESVAVLACENAEANIKRKLQGDDAMAAIMSFTFPDADAWPFAALSGYTEINKNIADMSGSTEHALSVIVQPSQCEEFNKFAKKMYQDEGFPETAGVSDFGFGIWKRDTNDPPLYEDGRIPDVTGENPTSDSDILVPFMHVAHKESNFFMYNLHSSQTKAKDLDDIVQCGVDAKAENVSAAFPPCGAITDFEFLNHRDTPAAVVRKPIFPRNNATTVVGFISVSVFWEDILLNIVP